MSKALSAARFTVDEFVRGDLALQALEYARYDVVILDLGLPDQDGLQVLKTIRERGDTVPILILTSRIQVSERIKGLDAGADDYLTKPFAMGELIARLYALLRRPHNALGSILGAGNLSFDTGAREVLLEGVPIQLSSREIDLLEHLMRRQGRVVSKTLLEDSLYGFSKELSSNAVEVLVCRLRKKLVDASAEVRIHTIHGVGYMLSSIAEKP